MSELTHAEIPWSHNVEAGTIESAAGYTVCYIVPHARINTVARTGQTHSHADADFIVRAVNSHGALLAAHEPERSGPEFLDWIADCLVHVYHESPNADFVLALRRRAEKARAAIAKATGVVRRAAEGLRETKGAAVSEQEKKIAGGQHTMSRVGDCMLLWPAVFDDPAAPFHPEATPYQRRGAAIASALGGWSAARLAVERHPNFGETMAMLSEFTGCGCDVEALMKAADEWREEGRKEQP